MSSSSDSGERLPVVGAGLATPLPALVGRSRDELARLLEPHLDRPFRLRQIEDAIHRRAVADLGAMTDLPLDLRQRLAEHVRVRPLEVAERHRSADGTVKVLFRLDDGGLIEAVDIPDTAADGNRRTFCISSQAGCGFACRFCVTGYWGPGRNLSAGEIVEQVLAIRRDRDLAPDAFNLVFMGMGEPLQNLGAVRSALEILTEHMSWRRITVSTVGVVPGIEAMASWPERPNLAVSLHAPDDERRSDLMPINRSWNLERLMESLRAFPLEPGRKITFEYILIRDWNDALSDADALASRVGSLGAERTKVNLIPINPDPVLGEAMVPPPDERIDAFRDRLRAHGLVATVRRRRGDDVSAACGQLRAAHRDPRGFRAGLHGP